MPTVEGFNEHRLTRTELGTLVRKYWLLVLIVFLSGTIAMWLSFPIFFTELYEAKTNLLVKVGRENAETPGSVQRGQVVTQGVQVTDTNSEVQILTSRALVESAVDRLGPDAFKSVLPPPQSIWGYPKFALKKVVRGVKFLYKECLIALDLQKRLTPWQEAVVRVSGGVKVEPVRDSSVLVLKVSMPSPRLAVDVSNALLDAYMKQRAAARQLPAGSVFFAERMAEADVRLKKARAEREAVRERWRLTAATEQRTAYLNQLSSIQGEITNNEAEIARLQQERELMLSRSQILPEMVRKEQVDASNPAIQSIKERVTSLKVERAKMTGRYLPSSDIVKKIDAEITHLEAALNNEPSSILNTVTREENPSRREFQLSIEQQAVRIAGLQKRNEYLSGPKMQLTARLRDLTLGMDALQSADLQYSRAEQDYVIYSKRLEEARMDEALDAQRVTNVAVVAPPETPITPASPRKMFLMGIAMAVSFVLGIALAAILETTEDRLLDEHGLAEMDDVAYLGTVELAG